MVRCFENGDITHVEGDINPIRDVEIIETELIFADLQAIERKIERLAKQAKSDKNAKALLDIASELKIHLEALKPVSTFNKKDDEVFIELNKELRFLSNKTIIYLANISEADIENKEDNQYVKTLSEHAKKADSLIIKICASIEEELISLEADEKKEFLDELGISLSGIEQISRASFDALNLISYFTAGIQEVRAWTIKKGTLAPKAAAVIHNDFEKGFIKAEVISYEDFVQNGGEAKAKEAGKLRLEGKEYIVQDGDIMHFKFNV